MAIRFLIRVDLPIDEEHESYAFFKSADRKLVFKLQKEIVELRDDLDKTEGTEERAVISNKILDLIYKIARDHFIRGKAFDMDLEEVKDMKAEDINSLPIAYVEGILLSKIFAQDLKVN